MSGEKGSVRRKAWSKDLGDELEGPGEGRVGQRRAGHTAGQGLPGRTGQAGISGPGTSVWDWGNRPSNEVRHVLCRLQCTLLHCTQLRGSQLSHSDCQTAQSPHRQACVRVQYQSGLGSQLCTYTIMRIHVEAMGR